MRHLADGALRRLHDEPLSLTTSQRRHYAACRRCQDRFAAISAGARAASAVLAVADVRVDTVAALARTRRLIAAQSGSTAVRPSRRPFERIMTVYQTQKSRWLKPAGGLVAAAALVGALALTPAGSLAASFITIFEPTQITAVPITPADLQGLRSLPNLDAYGTMGQSSSPQFHQVSSLDAAASATGLTLLKPSALPSGIPSTVTYLAASRGTASFTFSAAKARAAAASSGKALPQMPADLDGSTLQLTVGPAVAAVYGGDVTAAAPHAGARGLHVKRIVVKAAKAALDDLPTLIIGEAAVPRVTSTGASATAIRDYLLEQPGVSPALAAEIRAIGDPSTVLPIPVPVTRATSQTVQVHGVSGLAIGDNTGLGSVVVWQQHGMVYAVAGALPEDQILAIANGLS